MKRKGTVGEPRHDQNKKRRPASEVSESWNASVYIYGQFGSKLAVDLYWASVPRTHQVVCPATKKPLPPPRL